MRTVTEKDTISVKPASHLSIGDVLRFEQATRPQIVTSVNQATPSGTRVGINGMTALFENYATFLVVGQYQT